MIRLSACRSGRQLVSLAFVYCILSDARTADAPAVSAVFGRLPLLEDVALSPHGPQLAWARNEGERHFAVVSPADGSSVDRTVLYVRFIEEGAVVWKPLSIKDGTSGAPLANGEAFDGVIKERLTGRILGGSYGIDADGYVFFDPQSQARWNTVRQAFAGEHVRLVSHTDDFSKLIVQVFGSTHGYVYEVIDWNPVRAQPLGSIYEDLDTIAPVQSIRYPAADGLDISAVLTLPRDRPARNLPMVVMPHDGPASVVAARFNWWAQALAALGYAVLQPNFRGSNLNRHFVEAGFGEWGRQMQTDLSDGVRYLGSADSWRKNTRLSQPEPRIHQKTENKIT